MFIVLVRVKGILLHYTEFPPKQWIRHKFLTDGVSKSNQRFSTKLQKFGTKTQLKIWNRFVPKRPTICSLDCCGQRQFYLNQHYLLDQSSAWYSHFVNNEFRRKRMNCFKRFIFVNSDNTFHLTNFTTLIAVLSNYQTILFYALHSEVWPCV